MRYLNTSQRIYCDQNLFFFFIRTDRFNKSESLLMNIIDRMEYVLLPESADSANANESQNIEDLLDYKQWEKKTTQKYQVQIPF